MEPKEKENRPAFAGLRGNSPEKMFGNLITPCYILDEAALRHNGEILASLAQHTGSGAAGPESVLRLCPVPGAGPVPGRHEASSLYEAQLGGGRNAGQGSPCILRRLPGGPAGRNASLCGPSGVQFSPAAGSLWPSGQSCRQKCRSCGSIRNVLPRRPMPFMIPALPAAGWAPPWNSGRSG